MDMHDAISSYRAAQSGYLPGHVGLDWSEIRQGLVRGHFEVSRQHLALNGYLHAAAVIALADTACGYGCIASLPEGANGFTTVELKVNFIGTALEGIVSCEARLVHGGRTTQVWDAEVKSEVSGKTIALFRCTQMILTKPRGTQQPAEARRSTTSLRRSTSRARGEYPKKHQRPP